MVRPGEKVATDGIVEEGTSAIDASLLTGESVPVEVGPGDAVTGATVNAGGRLVVRATRVGADTQLAQMARLVTDAQNGKAPVQRLADRVSAVFVPVVIALAVATLGFWLGADAGAADRVHRRGGGADHRLPLRPRARHAHRAARRHRPGRPARHPHQGPRGARVDPAGRHDRVGQDRHGHHRADDPPSTSSPAPASTRRRCCASSARSRTPPSTPSPRPSPAPPASGSAPCPPVESFENRQGLGVQGVVDGHAVVAGRAQLLADWSLHLPPELEAAKATAEAAGRTAIAAGWDGQVRAVLVVADAVKADLGRGDQPAARPRAAPGAAHRRQRARRPAPWPRRSGSTR